MTKPGMNALAPAQPAARRSAKVMMVLAGAIIAACFSMGEADAQETDGCPAGTFETALTPDGGTLTILFDSFLVTLADGAETSRSTCHLHIPLPLPPNTSIGVYKVDYRGFAHLARQQQFEFAITYGFNDGREHSYRRQLRGPTDENFSLSQTIGAGLMRRVGCGETAALDLDATITLNSRDRAGEAYGGLDTYDGAPRGGLVYQFEFRACNAG